MEINIILSGLIIIVHIISILKVIVNLIIMHLASKETFHYFKAKPTKIHSIKINHIWTQIIFNTSQ